MVSAHGTGRISAVVRQRDVLLVVALPLRVHSPVLERCSRLRLLQGLQHLQVLLVDLLDVLLPLGEIERAWCPWHSD